MNREQFFEQYNFTGKTIVLTGGAGVLGWAIAEALHSLGANIVLLNRSPQRAAGRIASLSHGQERAASFPCDVLQKDQLESACAQTLALFGRIDALVNAAGGNLPQGVTNAQQSFFDLPEEAVQHILNLNWIGAFLPSQVFGAAMAKAGEGVILNFASMGSFRPLTRAPAYFAAKAALVNFSQWLAVYLATEFSPGLRVNTLAPGFFLGDQNRYLLIDENTGELTERGSKILQATPMRRFGDPADLIGAALWLLSPASGFVTGVVIPVDGGFQAFGGV